MTKLLVFLSLLIPHQLLALESTDVMPTRILKAYDRNVLVVNRGVEDGIYRHDHIKLTNDNGFIARGICIKVTMLTSHWKIYRITRPELLSMDSMYDLRSINQSEIPQDISKLKEIDFKKILRYGDRNVLRQLKLQNDRIVRYDLPQKVKQSDIYREKNKSKFEAFVEKNFQAKNFEEDLSQTRLELFASPYTFETLYDQRESHYGARLFNRGKKYQYEIFALERQKKLIDPFDQNRNYSTKATQYKLNFQINRVTDNWSLISFVQFDREKFGRIYYPHRFYRAAPLGFKYHIWEDNPLTDFFEISYAPSFDLIEYNDLTVSTTDSLRERVGFRHTLQATINATMSESWSSRFNLYYAPYAESPGADIDWGDNMLSVSQSFNYKLAENVFFDYRLQYMRDELRAQTYSIRPDNGINTFRLRYEISL
jgi:hypothetical protein